MNRPLLNAGIHATCLIILAASLFIGPTMNATGTGFSLIFGGHGNDAALVSAILFDVRLPRILLVFLTGAVLAICGGSLQAVFRNPLADPYILGLSSGAAFGAAFALAFASWLPVQAAAFVCGMGAVATSYAIAHKRHTVSIVSLVLAGIVVNGICTALLTIVQFVSDPFKLQTIVHWTMGNFHNASWRHFVPAAIPACAGAVVLLLMSWRMNVLALGDEEAVAAGMRPGHEKAVILVAAALAASSVVAVAGIIGLYGLIVPHIVRMIAGADNHRAMPLNAMVGGAFLVLVDTISRSIAGQEIPIGVFTLLIGAPVFIFIMRKYGAGWEP